MTFAILKHRHFKSTFAQLLARGATVLVTVIITIILRRTYGTSGYGEYTYIINFALLFLSFIDLGTHLTIVREVSVSHQKDQVLKTFVFLRIITVLIVLGIVNLAPLFITFPPSLTATLLGINLFIFVSALKETIAVIFHAQNKLHLTALTQITSVVSSLFAGIFIVSKGLSINHFFYYQALASLILLLLLYLKFGKLSALSGKLPRWLELRSLVFQSLPLGITLMLFTIYSKVDTFLIQSLISTEAVGQYGLSYKVYENLVLPAAFVMNTLLAELSQNRGEHSKFVQKTLKAAKLLFTLSLVVALATYILSPFIIQILTGELASTEIHILKILIFASVFAYLNHVTGYALVALKLQTRALTIAALALIINIVANLLTIPIWGVKAAAYNTVLTEAIVLVGSTLVIKKALTKATH
jgi:O-antigen/teichoic acid export membrane protein